jgi:hypothetical protein
VSLAAPSTWFRTESAQLDNPVYVDAEYTLRRQSAPLVEQRFDGSYRAFVVGSRVQIKVFTIFLSLFIFKDYSIYQDTIIKNLIFICIYLAISTYLSI